MKIKDALSFSEIYEKIKKLPMPLRLAYKFNKLNLRILQENSFYADSINLLLEQYAERDEFGSYKMGSNAGEVVIHKEYAAECQEKVRELQNLEIEDLNITFTLDELECLTITPAELSCIESLITE
jgi:hypothetical protein